MTLTSDSIADKIKNDGGVTIHARTGSEPTSGYAVSLPGYERTVPLAEFTASHLVKYVGDSWQGLSKGSAHLGAWIDGDTVYLDVSIVVPLQDDAIQLGREYGQLAVFNLATFDELRLDTVQA